MPGCKGVSQTMLRLSKLTDYAVVVLVRLSRETGVQTSPGIAATTGIPEPTVAKVLKTLAAARAGGVAARRARRLSAAAAARGHSGGRRDRRDGWADRADRLRGRLRRGMRSPRACARCVGAGTR